jgi:hypothetical protein
MDRLRQWLESRNTNFDDGPYISIRPPPLRTSNTYDDDETFNNASLHLLSRYKALGLSSREAIVSLLVTPKQRVSYYDGLCVRLDRLAHLPSTTAKLVHSIDQTFGNELRYIVEQESNGKGMNPYHKPIAPRHVSSDHHHHHHHHTSSSNNSHGSSTNSQKNKMKKSRRFFPECNGSFDSNKSSTNNVSFFRKNNRVQNIDWRLAQAIERVETLRLDGDDEPTVLGSCSSTVGSYQPPQQQSFS